MTIRGTLLAIWAIFWLAALACWLRSRRFRDWRLTGETWLFLGLGLPFLIAGAFFTKTSYPGEVWVATPAPTPTPAVVVAVAKPKPVATPVPVYAEAVNAAQHDAVARYPDLGRAGTAFNSRFVAMYRRLRYEEPSYFLDPHWPLQLADEVARTMPSDQ